MKQLPLIPDSNDDEQTPLPLIVAQRWNFKLTYIRTEKGLLYCIQDWISNLLNSSPRQEVEKLKYLYPEIKLNILNTSYKTPTGGVNLDYTDEETLILFIAYPYQEKDLERIQIVRHFIANLSDKYAYLRAIQKSKFKNPESIFQEKLVSRLKLILENYDIHQNYLTILGRRIDILATNNTKSHSSVTEELSYLLIECKANSDGFYGAVGQVICYNEEVFRKIPTPHYTLAIAIPYGFIDDYMREIATRLFIRLISIRDEMLIDVVTEEAIESIDQIITTGKRLLPNG